jgi:hypothetical protein
MSGQEQGWADMFALSTGTWIVFLVIGGVALQAIRNHASILSLLLALPLVVLMSVAVNHAFRVMLFFNPDKMAEWLAWTIMAGTLGTLIGVAMTIMIDRLIDRVPTEPHVSK